MLEEERGPVRLQHAPDLAQPAHRIRHRAEDARGGHRVERAVGERERLDVRLAQLDGEAEPSRAGPGPVEHPLRQVDPNELQARRVEVEVAAGADAHLEHVALSRLEHAPPPRGTAQPVHGRLDHVVDRGDAIVDALGGGSRAGAVAFVANALIAAAHRVTRDPGRTVGSE